jgi:hypothetical protein
MVVLHNIILLYCYILICIVTLAIWSKCQSSFRIKAGSGSLDFMSLGNLPLLC